jgi:hypothetical protein
MDPTSATLAVGPIGVTPANFVVSDPSGLATVRLDAPGGGVAAGPPQPFPPDSQIGPGPGNEYLGPPDIWLVINVSGTDYQFPGYL